MGFSKKYVIITAGGRGERMGSDKPKQFLELEGEPILRRTMDLFASLPFPVEIITAIGQDMMEEWKKYCVSVDYRVRHTLSAGGISRFHSVKNALKYVTPGSLVAVHDGVRPFVPRKMICSLFEAAEEHQAVIPYIEVPDSMRFRNGEGVCVPADRSKYMLIQTPQVFHSDVLLDSYSQPFSPCFTDDSTVVGAKKYPLSFFKGSRYNIKITTPEDLFLGRRFLAGGIIDPDLSFDGLVK